MVYQTTYSSGQHKVYALNSDGTSVPGWPVSAPSHISGAYIPIAPAIGLDGTLFVVWRPSNYALDAELWAYNPDGSQKWQNPYLIGPGVIAGNLLVDVLGAVYVNNFGSGLHIVQPDGTQKQRIEYVDPYKTPVVAWDLNIYTAGGTTDPEGGFTSFNPDGTVRWHNSYGGTSNNPSWFSTPSIGPNGHIYVLRWFTQSPNATMLELDSLNGNIVNQIDCPNPGDNNSKPISISTNGTVVYPTSDHRLVGFPADLSSMTIDYNFGTYIFASSPIIDGDGKIYFSVFDGAQSSKIIALNPDGTELDVNTINSPYMMTTGSMGSTGRLYFGGQEGKLYSFAGPPPTGVQPTLPVAPGVPPGPRGFCYPYTPENCPGSVTKHLGIDYLNPPGDDVFSIGPGGQIKSFSTQISGYGAWGCIYEKVKGKLECVQEQSYGNGPILWVEYTLVSGNPIYIQYGHTADSSNQATQLGCNWVFQETYTINWILGAPVGSGVVVGKTTPYFWVADVRSNPTSICGSSNEHLHFGVFKPNHSCSGGTAWCSPPTTQMGYGPNLVTPTGEWIDSALLFDPAHPEYQIIE